MSQVSLQLTEHDLELLTLSTQGLHRCVCRHPWLLRYGRSNPGPCARCASTLLPSLKAEFPSSVLCLHACFKSFQKFLQEATCCSFLPLFSCPRRSQPPVPFPLGLPASLLCPQSRQEGCQGVDLDSFWQTILNPPTRGEGLGTPSPHPV